MVMQEPGQRPDESEYWPIEAAAVVLALAIIAFVIGMWTNVLWSQLW
jgi:hypothetical protein